MTDNPIELVVAAFKDEETANLALKQLKESSKAGQIKIENAAVLRKDVKGKLRINETHDMGGGKGAAIGGVAGAAIGLLAGPALVVPAAVGALVGGLVAKLRDSGFSDQRLETLGEGLQPGSSAIVAVVEHTWVGKIEQALAEAQADLITAEIKADVASQLEAGHDVAYSAISSQEGFTASRLAVGEDMVEGGMLAMDESSVYGGRFIATTEGFAVEQIVADDNEEVGEVVLGTFEEDTQEEEE